MAEDDFALECDGIEKTFGRKAVLRGISLRIRKKAILGLVGPNGAGKTTLLKILSGLIPASRGEAKICGRDLGVDARGAKGLLGFVSSEERSFYWRLSGRDNLKFFAALQGISGRERSRRVDGLLEELGLEGQGGVRFQEYSSGMKQALCLARALLHDPPVLLLDEPTRSLSPNAARGFRDLLRDKAREGGKSILVASHNLHEVEELADEVALIHGGAIATIGTLSSLRCGAGLPPEAGLDAVFEYFIPGA